MLPSVESLIRGGQAGTRPGAAGTATGQSGTSAAATSADRGVIDVRDRNLPLERQLDHLASQSAGYSDDGGLGDYANYRANPGGVRCPPGRDFHLEAAQELADCRNYVVWRIEQIRELHEAGDPDANDEYVRLMGCLEGVVAAWRALHQL